MSGKHQHYMVLLDVSPDRCPRDSLHCQQADEVHAESEYGGHPNNSYYTYSNLSSQRVRNPDRRDAYCTAAPALSLRWAPHRALRV
mmetsp:Transcript_147982/g.368799  ORF Transcript_147982/g.368799 Transcript_147982/m.368799 type:complete len:86 (-) Transcript_147982:1923-2180(-)